MKPTQKNLIFSLIFILLIISFAIPNINSNKVLDNNDQNNYIIQTSESIVSIIIDGNDDLASHPMVTGNGIWSDPYLIDNYKILGSGSDIGINISNTNKPFIIQNCSIENYLHGISLTNVSNGKIENNTMLNNTYSGISVYNSHNNTLIDNTALNNEDGILISYSDNNTLKENNASYNNRFGLWISNSAINNTIIGNTALNNKVDGIHLHRTHNNTIIDNNVSNNKLNGIYLDESHNNTILGNTANSHENYGIMISGSINNTLSNNTASQNGEYGIILLNSDYNMLTNNTALNNNRTGIILSNSNNNILTDNIILQNIDSGIRLDYSNNNTIMNNTASHNTHGIYLYHSNNNTLKNDTTSYNGYGIYLYYSDNNTLMKNIALDNSVYGIFLSYSEYCTLFENIMKSSGIWIFGSLFDLLSLEINESNTVNYKSIYYFKNQIGLKKSDYTDPGQIILINCSNSDISEVNISNSSMGISLFYSDNNILTSNNASNNTVCGIYLYNSDENMLIGNTVSNNSYYGIYLMRWSDENSIMGNIASNNGENGFHFYASDNNTITDNMVSNNQENGIHLRESDNNRIMDSTISHNQDTGLYIDFYSENNTIYNNFIIENDLNAYDDGAGNQWDNGTIGNYWDDYSGMDLNNDGVGESPYNISGYQESQDSYPIWDFGPTITINYPNNIIEIGSNMPSFIVENSDARLDTMWYSLNGGDNIKFTSDFTFNQAEWDLLPDGIVTITFYANNTEGKIYSESIIIIKNTIPIIISPSNNEEFGSEVPSFIVEVSDPQLDTMWYSLNGGRNIIFTSNNTFNQVEWELLPDGIVTITFYANDTKGNIASKSITIIKNTSPIITIISPSNNEEFGSEAPSFIVEIFHPQLHTMWYSLNGGKNITFTSNNTFNQVDWELLPDGIVTITFYANNTEGKIASESITIIKDTSPDTNGSIPSYSIMIIISITAIALIFLVAKYQKKIKY